MDSFRRLLLLIGVGPSFSPHSAFSRACTAIYGASMDSFRRLLLLIGVGPSFSPHSDDTKAEMTNYGYVALVMVIFTVVEILTFPWLIRKMALALNHWLHLSEQGVREVLSNKKSTINMVLNALGIILQFAYLFFLLMQIMPGWAVISGWCSVACITIAALIPVLLDGFMSLFANMQNMSRLGKLVGANVHIAISLCSKMFHLQILELPVFALIVAFVDSVKELNDYIKSVRARNGNPNIEMTTTRM